MDALDKAISQFEDPTFFQYVFGGIMAAIKKAKKKPTKAPALVTKQRYPVKIGKATNKVPTVTVFGIEFEQGDGDAGIAVATTNYYGQVGRKWNTIKFENTYIMWGRHNQDGYLDLFSVPENHFTQNFAWDTDEDG